MNHREYRGAQRVVYRFLVVIALATNLFASNKTTERADRILVLKSERKMVLYSGDRLLRTYRISLGSEPLGPKTRQDDHHTPEGNYVIDSRNSSSRFHRALHISYPNVQDRERAKRDGVNPGGDIMIHGLPNGLGGIGKAHLLRDWTDGCIAVTNDEIDEIWSLVPNGTPIEIKP